MITISTNLVTEIYKLEINKHQLIIWKYFHKLFDNNTTISILYAESCLYHTATSYNQLGSSRGSGIKGPGNEIPCENMWPGGLMPWGQLMIEISTRGTSGKCSQCAGGQGHQTEVLNPLTPGVKCCLCPSQEMPHGISYLRDILVNTGSGDGLLPDGTKSLPEAMLFYQ